MTAACLLAAPVSLLLSPFLLLFFAFGKINYQTIHEKSWKVSKCPEHIFLCNTAFICLFKQEKGKKCWTSRENWQPSFKAVYCKVFVVVWILRKKWELLKRLRILNLVWWADKQVLPHCSLLLTLILKDDGMNLMTLGQKFFAIFQIEDLRIFSSAGLSCV